MAVIDSCIEDGILVDILSAERARIMASVLAGFNKRAYGRIMKSEGYEDGYDAGVDFGCQEEKTSVITRMLANHYSDVEIMTIANCSQEMIDTARSKINKKQA